MYAPENADVPVGSRIALAAVTCQGSPGNSSLTCAYCATRERWAAFGEFRGEGCVILIAKTPGRCHDMGKIAHTTVPNLILSSLTATTALLNPC